MGVKLVRLDKADPGAKGIIVDVIDTSDPNLIFMEGQLLGDSKTQGNGVMRSDNRIFVHQKVNAVDYVVNDVLRISGLFGKLGLLRFHGHGLPGYQGVWARALSPYMTGVEIGLGLKTESQVEAIATKEYKNPESRVAISRWNLTSISPSLSRLRPVFAEGAEVWLMGCRVGMGKAGLELVMGLAQRLGVAVKAGADYQLGGDDAGLAYLNYLHEGPVVVGNPGR